MTKLIKTFEAGTTLRVRVYENDKKDHISIVQSGHLRLILSSEQAQDLFVALEDAVDLIYDRLRSKTTKRKGSHTD